MTLRREAVFTFAGVLTGGPVLAKGQGQGHGGGAGGPAKAAAMVALMGTDQVRVRVMRVGGPGLASGSLV